MMSWSGFFFFNPSSYLMEIIISINDYVSLFMSSILILVVMNMMTLTLLKGFDMNFYENHQLESVWTMVPFIILIMILVPSLNSLYMLDSCMFCGLPIFIVGHQWYWSYNLPEKEVFFDSFMNKELSSSLRLLETDNSLVIPFSIPIRCILSSADVIHSWTIQSLGIKMDAIPGRANNFCFSVKRPGTFFGQCSEICGINHSFMPISLEAVSLEDFLQSK